MSIVHDCYALTKKLLHTVAAAAPDRDSQIEQAEKLLEQRGQLLPAIQPPFTEEEQKAGREMALMNKQIDRHLQRLNEAVKKDLTDVKRKKQTVDRYLDPYEALQTDGIFYDKRN